MFPDTPRSLLKKLQPEPKKIAKIEEILEVEEGEEVTDEEENIAKIYIQDF